MKISVIGKGYVGLVAGACFADTGNEVTCVDKDQNKIEQLNDGKIPIYEPGLENLVKRAASEKRLRFTTSTPDAVKDSDIIFFAVGTPSTATGESDLSFLKAAAQEVASAMDGYRIVVNKSTVPVGTHKKVAGWMAEKTQHRFDVVSNPEFLKEGTAVDDFLKPDRVVIGTRSDEVYEKMAELYAPFVRQGNPVLRMDPVSAEVAKYACNAFLATRISFMNELSQLCEKVDADIEDIRRGMVTDHRIGKHFLYAGVGYGGSCFPKDVKALLSTGRETDTPLRIVAASEEANEAQKKHLMSHIQKHYSGNIKDKVFSLMGLAFKPNTDDIREAPALVMIEELLKNGAKVRAYDPVAMEGVRKEIGDRVQFCSSYYEAAQDSDAAVIMTEWNEFRHPDFSELKKRLREPVIFDGRNVYDPKKMRKLGFRYYGVGRPHV